MEIRAVICKESFMINGRGIIVFLKHQEYGLKKDTVLKSKKTNQKWKIESRILCDHAIKSHKIFEAESVNYMRISFKDLESRESSIQKIIKEESKSIFQYIIKPINHNEKPMKGDELIIEDLSETV